MANGGKREGAGRKKARHTIEKEEAKKILIAAYIAHIKPINDALIKKATEGDIQAIRELHDRVYGKATQAIELSGKDGGAIEFKDKTDVELAQIAGLKD